MRKIKFRVWDEHFIEMLYDLTSIGILPEGFYFEKGSDRSGGSRNLSNLNQSTGLKDKNGVEIYEGDIIQGSNKSRLFPTGYIKVEIPSIYELYYSNTFESWDTVKVVGNIYENPKLNLGPKK